MAYEKQVLGCAKRFMERHSCELVDAINESGIEPYFNYVFKCEDENTVIFINVSYLHHAEDFGDEEPLDRRDWERKMTSWFMHHSQDYDGDLTDMNVRLDTVRINVISNDRALIQHHINALGVEG